MSWIILERETGLFQSFAGNFSKNYGRRFYLVFSLTVHRLFINSFLLLFSLNSFNFSVCLSYTIGDVFSPC